MPPHPQKVPSLTEHLSPRGSVDVEAERHDKHPPTHDSWQAMLRYDAARRRDSSMSYHGGTGVFQPPVGGSPEMRVQSPMQMAAEDSAEAANNDADSSSITMRKLSKGQSPSTRTSLHLGDDLPHMPEQLPSGFISPPLPPLPTPQSQLAGMTPSTRRESFTSAGEATLRSPPAPRISGSTLDDKVKKIGEEGEHDPYVPSAPALYRQVTPPALKGSNAVLVDRELERLRDKKAKEIKMKWRTVTGCFVLLLFGFSAYILIEYVFAYLALSPSNWFLSDAQDGTQTSPDPLLRSLALVGMAIEAIAILGVLLSGFYLRFSRRRTCTTVAIWIIAIVSTTLNLALAVVNLSLIALWHKKYSDAPNDALAKTRDVAQRCNGVWDMDLLWSAAKASPIAKSSDSDAVTSGCSHDAKKTLLMFFIGGGLRLGILVFLCAVWMACLARYNRSLAIVAIVDLDMKESAEMQKLLMEEGASLPVGGYEDAAYRDADKHRTMTGEKDLPAMPTEPRDSFVVPGSYDFESEDRMMSGSGYDGDTLRDSASQAHFRSSQSHTSHEPPTLQHFAWQQNKARARNSIDEDEQVYTYGNMPQHHAAHRHERSGSAGQWSQGILDRLWTALWGDSPASAETQAQGRMVDEKGTLLAAPAPQLAPTQEHQREGSRLGVGGWFRRDASDGNWQMQGSETDACDWKLREESLNLPNYQHYEGNVAAPPLPPPKPSSSDVLQRHQRTSSQERRSREARHAASNQSSSRSRSNSRDRVEQRQRDQHDRITFLASLGYGSGEEGHANSSGQQQGERVGDDLPPMPMVRDSASRREIPQSNSHHGRKDIYEGQDEDDEEDDVFWRGPGPSSSSSSSSRGVENDRNLLQPSTTAPNQPVFVRTLGRLVRKLSAIESVGSGEGRRSGSGATSQHQFDGGRNGRGSSSSSHYRSGSRAGQQRSFEGVAMAGRGMGTVDEIDW